MFKGNHGDNVVKDTLDKEKVPYMVVDNGGKLNFTTNNINNNNNNNNRNNNDDDDDE